MDRTNIHIVEAVPSDAPLIGKVVVSALGDTLATSFAGAQGMAAVDRLFAHLAARDDSQYSYRNTLKAIDRESRPMGFVIGYDGAELHRLRRAFFEATRTMLGRDLTGHMGEECEANEFYLDSIAVFEEYRGQGVARALIEALSRRAARSGKPLGLLCEKTNTRARQLYESLGFRRVGETLFANEPMDHMQR